ncbi:MAG: hypothetical protein ABFD89_05395 [Bryobacteraceae bacterium]
MELTRRDMLLGSIALSTAQDAFSAKSGHRLRAGNLQATLTPEGGLRELRAGNTVLTAPVPGDACPEVGVAGRPVRCGRPIRATRTASGLVFEDRLEEPVPLRVTYEVSLRALPGAAGVLVQRIALASTRPYSEPIELKLPRNIRLPQERRAHCAPLREGVLRRSPIADGGGSEFVYKMAGDGTSAEAPKLAIPQLGEYSESGSLRITLCSDPGFTTIFRLCSGQEAGRFGWVHTAGGGAESTVERTFYTVVHSGPEADDFRHFYATSLHGENAGPEWLHDVTLVYYDYLGKNGRGWFADIDALANLIPAGKRNKVALALHGWYDYVGRYAFDPKTKALDKAWTAFPNVKDPGFIAHATGPLSKTARFWGWNKIMAALRPVEMTKEDLHRRIRYARDRGFRCTLYFADGLNSGEGLAGIHDPSKVLKWGGWVGPETSGKTYAQNPLHPAVRSFYKDYLQTLIAEFGRELDGFVWDETFHAPAGQMGTAPYTGYADAAMMSLMAELRRITERHNPEMAFLSSDCLSPSYEGPYALMSHGTFQDTMCHPRAWPYGLFPNRRNTLWSCNWYHQSTWDRNEGAVATYEFPVSVSNGYGDDTGPSDMNREQVEKMMALFTKLGDRKLDITWIEETAGVKTYRGRPVVTK